ncbi:MAG: PDZ domain-containing protein, partial [Rubrivivax sp.]|nr:PDZ domain-containing protein [Rubrivivax sp.]
VNRIVPRLIRDGRFVRPALGIAAGPSSLQRALNLPRGVVLVQVAASGPAGRAGLQPFRRNGNRGEIVPGDVITAIGDDPVSDLDDLLNQLERRAVGETVTLSVWRSGQSRRVPVLLSAAEQ